jgi:hypothetical protein
MTRREVRCTSCGVLNGVPRYSIARIPSCGKCHAALPELGTTKAFRHLYRFRFLGGAAVLALIVLLSLWAPWAPTVTSKQVVAETCSGRPQPSQGEYEISDFSPRVAPFKINTAAGFNYLVKLESVNNSFASLSFFIYGGEPFETEVPLGVYVLKYAAGKTWCSRKNLFGKDTFAKKGSRRLVFEQKYNGYNGQEITLIEQRSGNFHTEYITLSEF